MAMTKEYDPRRDGPKRPMPPIPRPTPLPRPMPTPLPRPPKPRKPGKPMQAPGGGIIGGWGAATPGGFNAESFLDSKKEFMQNPGSEAQAQEQALEQDNIARQKAIMAALSKPSKGSNTPAPIAQFKVK